MIVSVIASAVSGIVLSQHLYRFLKISKGASIARSVHLVCAYLNYILMSLHLGLHWNTMIAAMPKGRDFGRQMDPETSGGRHCGLWHLCLFQTSDRRISFPADSFCVP